MTAQGIFGPRTYLVVTERFVHAARRLGPGDLVFRELPVTPLTRH
ncbi:double-CXXCG motif protein [Corallococcus terminator]|nr:double-CXXCG motif protein [Corallococcus terminator]